MKLMKYVLALFFLSTFMVSCSQDAIAADDSLFLNQDVIGDGDEKHKPPPPPDHP